MHGFNVNCSGISPGENPMKQLFLILILLSASAFAVTPELEEGVALVSQMRDDQCQRQKLRSEILLAHSSHDVGKVDKLGPQLDAINKRIKPAEDRLNVLKPAIRKNFNEQSAFETAQLNLKACD